MEFDMGQLRAISTVVAEGTFEAAARAMHVTPSALSQRIKALETVTGRVLLVRSKPVVPTESGRVLLRLARQVDLLVGETAIELGSHEPHDVDDAGTGVPRAAPVVLPIAVNADSLATWLLPTLAPLAGRLCFDLRRGDEEQTSALLRQGVVMAAISTEAVPVPGCTATPLGAMTYRPVASPQFTERWFPDGPTPRALHQAPVVVLDRDDDLQHRYLRHRTRGHPTMPNPPTHCVPASADFIAAIRLGFGWGMAPDLQRRDLLDDGRLVVLDDRGKVSVQLHWQQWKLRSASLNALADAVLHGARRNLDR